MLHLLGSSWLWYFPRLALLLMTLTVLRSPGRLFCGMTLNLGLFDVFSWLEWGYRLLEEDHRGKALFLSHHIMHTHCQYEYRWWCWPWSPAKAVFVRFPHCKVTLFLSFRTALFGRKSMCSAYPWRGGLGPPPWGRNIYTDHWNSSAGEVCLFSAIY